jgi:type VI secretion system ImpM family protein
MPNPPRIGEGPSQARDPAPDPPRPPTGLFGKLPAHGDFLCRALPDSFVQPWDDWLQAGMAEARATLGEESYAEAWSSAPAWRFLLPPQACGPDAVAGLLLASEDLVGRRFPTHPGRAAGRRRHCAGGGLVRGPARGRRSPRPHRRQPPRRPAENLDGG